MSSTPAKIAETNSTLDKKFEGLFSHWDRAIIAPIDFNPMFVRLINDSNVAEAFGRVPDAALPSLKRFIFKRSIQNDPGDYGRSLKIAQDFLRSQGGEDGDEA